MATFVPCGRDWAFLLPPDIEDWLPDDDLAHFVIAAAERVSMGMFQLNDRNSSKPQYHPCMMLALLVHAYTDGLFSSRRIERAMQHDLGIRFVTAVKASRAKDFETFVAIGRTQPHCPYDFHPPSMPKTQQRISQLWRIVMMAKLDTEEGRALYKKHKQTVEPVFGIIRSATGLRVSRYAGSATQQPSGRSSCWPATAGAWSPWEKRDHFQLTQSQIKSLPNISVQPVNPADC